MKTFDFSIIASGLDPEAEDFADRFFNAGCDDATISFQKGHIIVDFAREAASIGAAIVSAMECVNATGAMVDRIEPDSLVSLSDIASRTGMSRAAMTQYSKGQRSKDFPSPVAKVTSDSPLWDWATVAKWLFQHGKISREAAMEAAAVRVANVAIESHQPKLLEAMQDSLRCYEEDLENRAA
jgi:predicted DNA-binding transcriptional regulator AlpA